MQFDEHERGFSFQKDGPLDMRMNVSDAITAKDIINQFSEKEIGRIFKDYGEEGMWKRGARAIVEARKRKKIETTFELKEIIEGVFPRRGKTHPATKIFQALRIFVNKELDHIEETMKKAFERLAPKGRLAVLTFHSLEDRIVKNVFRDMTSPTKNLYGKTVKRAAARLIEKKALTPSTFEIKRNRRSRSAKLRAVEKL